MLPTPRLHTPATAAAASCPLTEDVPLIESLEASKLLATEIGEKVAEAAETEIAINDSRNKYRPVAERGAMLFFLLNSLNKIHAFYQYRWVLRGLGCIRGWAAPPRARSALTIGCLCAYHLSAAACAVSTPLWWCLRGAWTWPQEAARSRRSLLPCVSCRSVCQGMRRTLRR